jgi:uncharacterized protein (TIGR02646 family)
MINVSRSSCPPSLSGPSSVGVKEAERAKAHFENRVPGQKAFTFRAYKRDDVRAALEGMFGPKCAYCETVYAGGHQMTIDHYRPKGGYELPSGKLQQPGYWWLASTWTNLLPTCTDCNSERGHDIEGSIRVIGKANRFPLADERRRARQPGREAGETPLLLDPTIDEPGDHLEFIGGGVVIAAETGGRESERGAQTIEVLALRRPHLVASRRNHLKKVEGTIRRYLRAVLRFDREGGPEALEALVEAVDDLRDYMDGSTQYAQMGRQWIRRELARAGLPLPF